jgi:hypothetical protein
MLDLGVFRLQRHLLHQEPGQVLTAALAVLHLGHADDAFGEHLALGALGDAAGYQVRPGLHARAGHAGASVAQQAGSLPAGGVEVRLAPRLLPSGVVFLDDAVVAVAPVGVRVVAGVDAEAPVLVGPHQRLRTVELAPQAPGAFRHQGGAVTEVDHLNGEHVAAGPQVRGDVQHVVALLVRQGLGRPAPGVFPVDPEAIQPAARDAQNRSLGDVVQREGPAGTGEDVRVTSGVEPHPRRFQLGHGQLPWFSCAKCRPWMLGTHAARRGGPARLRPRHRLPESARPHRRRSPASLPAGVEGFRRRMVREGDGQVNAPVRSVRVPAPGVCRCLPPRAPPRYNQQWRVPPQPWMNLRPKPLRLQAPRGPTRCCGAAR